MIEQLGYIFLFCLLYVLMFWLIGVIIPIFKKGDRKECSNHRGITLVSQVAILYESILEKRVRCIVEPQLRKEKYGFRQGRSTFDPIFTLRQVMEKAWEENTTMHMAFLDLEKAYDHLPRVWESLREKQMDEMEIERTSHPTLETFEVLLQENGHIFHPYRTPKSLQTQWQLMKQYHLLPDQIVQALPRGEHVLNFSDAEDLVQDADLADPRDESVEFNLTKADRRAKKEIRRLENEIGRWQVMVDSVTGISPPDFDNQTLAVIRGRLVRYLMRSREISIGRSTHDHSVDVDLALEGPAWKISRRQGVIRLRNNGDFFISSEGKRAVYVDGRAILAGNKFRLNNNSVIEIAGLRFIFLVNQDLISVIRHEAQKMNLQP